VKIKKAAQVTKRRMKGMKKKIFPFRDESLCGVYIDKQKDKKI